MFKSKQARTRQWKHLHLCSGKHLWERCTRYQYSIPLPRAPSPPDSMSERPGGSTLCSYHSCFSPFPNFGSVERAQCLFKKSLHMRRRYESDLILSRNPAANASQAAKKSGAGKAPPCSAMGPALADLGISVLVGASRSGDGAKGCSAYSSAHALDFLRTQ